MSYCSKQTPSISRHSSDSIIGRNLILHFPIERKARTATLVRRQRVGVGVGAGRRREAGADAEEEPGRIGAVEPARRSGVPGDIPRSLSLGIMNGEEGAAESVGGTRPDGVPYGGGAAGVGEELAGGGVVATRGRGGEGEGGGGEAREGGVDEGEEPRLGASGAEYSEHG